MTITLCYKLRQFFVLIVLIIVVCQAESVRTDLPVDRRSACLAAQHRHVPLHADAGRQHSKRQWRTMFRIS